MKLTKHELNTLETLFDEMYNYAIKYPGVQHNDRYKTLQGIHNKIRKENKK